MGREPRTTSLLVALVACTVLPAGEAAGQSVPIGIIDFYGLNRVSADRARAALTFQEGDAVALAGDEPAALRAASEARLATVPGVSRARVTLVCCDDGRAIAYVGIEESGSPAPSFRASPEGDARLAADVVQAGEDYSKALMAAVQRGDAAEDRSQGHSLANDPATRAVQDRLAVHADRDRRELRRVLRRSADAAQRALAAEILGHGADKSAVVDDLVHAMSDPSEAVRNNAMRALLVIAEMEPRAGRPVPRIPAEPFVALLSSPVWSDRNKASGALRALSRSRDPHLLEALRRPEAMTALAEMARWRSEGHAQAAFLILGRIAGRSDEDALALWRSGQREVVIDAAVTRPPGSGRRRGALGR